MNQSWKMSDISGCSIPAVRMHGPVVNFSGCRIVVVRAHGVGVVWVRFPAARPKNDYRKITTGCRWVRSPVAMRSICYCDRPGLTCPAPRPYEWEESYGFWRILSLASRACEFFEAGKKAREF